MKSPISRSCLLLTCLCLGVVNAAAPPSVPDPAVPAETLQSALAAATQQPDIAQRQAALVQAVTQAFDLPGASRLILRGAWSELDTEQQQAFTAALGPLIAANFASRFKPGVAAQFSGTEITDLPRGRASVRTAFARASNEPVTFDYVVHTADGQWRILNLLVGGVSDIALRSAQYTRQLQDQGFDAVLASMQAETKAAMGTNQ